MNQNLELEDVRKTMEISAKIKGASAMFTKKAVNEAMGDESDDSGCQCGDQNGAASTKSCC